MLQMLSSHTLFPVELFHWHPCGLQTGNRSVRYHADWSTRSIQKVLHSNLCWDVGHPD
jgi:hypothetical protein